MESLKDVTLIEHPFEIVAEGQMKKNAESKVTKPLVMLMLKKDMPIDGTLFRIVLFTQKVFNKLRSMI